MSSKELEDSIANYGGCVDRLEPSQNSITYEAEIRERIRSIAAEELEEKLEDTETYELENAPRYMERLQN